MTWLQRSARSIITGVAFFVGCVVGLTLLSSLFERIVPWRDTPWGGLEASGEIVGHEPVRTDTDLVYPVVTFVTATDEYRFVETRPFLAVDYPIGARVTVLYRGDNPDVARISSYEDLAFNAAAIVVVAMIVIIGIAGALRPHRH